jgi:chitin synthase
MYYFLGHNLWMDKLSVKRKQRKADYTFLLALDGDVDFEPLALILLVDLMKRNEKVGAACGRIHPIGSGQFEYYFGMMDCCMVLTMIRREKILY